MKKEQRQTNLYFWVKGGLSGICVYEQIFSGPTWMQDITFFGKTLAPLRKSSKS